MVEFHFTVSDIDAAVIFDCINDKIVEANMDCLTAIEKNDTDQHKWLKEEIKYLEELKLKMHNERV